MVYNLGMSKLKNGFPKFNTAVNAGDWQSAARESNRRPPISAARNQYVYDLFMQAAELTSDA